MLYLWVVLTVLAGLLNQQNKPKECLLFYEDKSAHILNLTDSTITAIPIPEFSLPASVYTSPDGSRRIVDNDDRELVYSVNQIKVERIDPPIPFAWKIRYSGDPFHPNAMWSPNGKMFVYLRNTRENESFIGLADPGGKVTKEIQVIDSKKYLTQLDSWSPDGQYFTMLIRPLEDIENIDQHITAKILSVPDFTDVTPIKLSSIPHNSCEWSNYTKVYCTYWSHTGHKVAFVQQTNNNFRVVISGLDTSAVQSYSLPILIKGELHNWFLLWSPNDEKVAVTYSAMRFSDDTSLYGQQLKIFYANKSKQITVDENANSALFRADGPPVPQWAWSADSSTMLYVRYSSDKTFETVGYNVTVSKKTVLVTFPSFNTEVRLYPSTDNKSILVYAYNHEKAWIYLVTFEGKQLWSKILDADYGNVFDAYTGWSPHNAYLATLKDSELIIYGSDGSIVYQKNFNGNFLQESLDWIDCP